MNVLVFGGAGYIGAHVCKALLRAGHEVVVFDNLSTGLMENVLSGSEFILGDILEPGALEQACSARPFDAFIHLAALKAAGESMREPERYARVNIQGTLHLLHAALRARIPCCVFSSSAAIYGEPRYLPLDEKHPMEPTNFYGFTKLQIEGFLEWYGRLRGLRYASLRYFNAAGYDPEGDVRGLERNPANLLPVIMETACRRRPALEIFGIDYPTRDGTGVRDYVHVTDLAEAHLLALDRLREGGTSLAVNLGSESGVSVLELLDAARRLTGREIPSRVTGRRPGDPATLVASSKLAESLLGWRARHSDVETLVRTHWNAYRAP